MTDDFLIIGAGIVGLATQALLERVGCQSTLVDIDERRIADLQRLGMNAAYRPHINNESVTAFVCVPTPSDQSNGFSLQAIHDAIYSVLNISTVRELTIVLRSTVLPGTCDTILNDLRAKKAKYSGCEIHIVYMPEFVRQAKWQQDAKSPIKIVFGSRSELALSRITKLFSEFSDRLVVLQNPNDAEMIKIVHNAYNASKISFWNEMYRIGQAQAINMQVVSHIVSATAEASWNPDYGTRGGAPFGGACLPKDLAALIVHAEQLGMPAHMLRSIREINEIEQQFRTSEA